MTTRATERPLQITRLWFRARYGQNFPELLSQDKNDFLDTCINDTYTLFAGVADLWSHLSRIEYVEKTQMCYGLLVAWYIADLFPDFTSGILSSGGIPIKSKKIGGVTIQFGETTTSSSASNADLLQSLKSNAFGAKAYLMIKTSGKLNFFIAR